MTKGSIISAVRHLSFTLGDFAVPGTAIIRNLLASSRAVEIQTARPPPVKRSTCVYILMIAIFAVGLWLILRFGSSRLTARPDLAGDWALVSLPGTPAEIQSAG